MIIQQKQQQQYCILVDVIFVLILIDNVLGVDDNMKMINVVDSGDGDGGGGGGR
jgi:hypothetical protein